MEKVTLEKLLSLKERVSGELETNLLPFWVAYFKDSQKKGCACQLSNTLEKESTTQGLVFHARLLWTFSSLYGVYSDFKYLRLARECYENILTHFMDREYGGAYWLVSATGQPEDARKKTYGQAFLIYALSEFYKCYAHSSIRDKCIEVFSLLDRSAFDTTHLGYYEVCERDWTLAEDQRLSAVDMNEPKSMNTHLHVLEALTNLLSIGDDPLVRRRLILLLDIFREKIVQPGTGHFGLFFDDGWTVRSRGISFGHEIEASWLICEAARVLNDPEVQSCAEGLAVQLAEGVYKNGFDISGGLNYEIDEQGNLDTDKHFWTQAEAAVGFLNAWEITGNDDYLDASISVWGLIQKYLVDSGSGEWYWKVDAQGVPDETLPKVSVWKSPYHNVRACIEIVKRINTLLSKHHREGSYIYHE